jgi:hypothetical protein
MSVYFFVGSREPLCNETPIALERERLSGSPLGQ